MKYGIVSDGIYIYAVSINAQGQNKVTREKYEQILSLLLERPIAQDGYEYLLRADTLEWELVELPPEPDPGEDEATAEDYEAALQELGVRV